MFSTKRSNDIVEAKKEEMSSTADKISELLRDLSVPYNKTVRALEASTGYNMHCMAPLSATHLEQKPSCLFMGSYSAGKTSAIKYLLQIDIAELRVGPEPTTDMFHVLTHGEKQITVGGVILMNDPHLGFQNFFPHNKDITRHFQLTRLKNPCLKAMDIIDSPGFLSGDNMIEQRGYDLPGVLVELAKRATRVYMMMDVFKVDISPECKETLRKMRSMMGKMRLIFNKADCVDSLNLIRLYGAFMYHSGMACSAPEVPHVFICSLWDKPYKHDGYRELFDSEKLGLLNDLQRLATCHYPHIVGNMIERLNCFLRFVVVTRQFKKVMPFFKKDKKKQEIISNFPTFYNDALRDEGIMAGDAIVYNLVFEAIKALDVNNLPDSSCKKTMDVIHSVLTTVVPKVLEKLNIVLNEDNDRKIEGGVFEIVDASNKLIQQEQEHGFHLTSESIEKADSVFATFRTVNGRADAGQLKPVMLESRLPYESLAKLWELSSDSSDGRMDMYEWRIASFLISYLINGNILPSVLPAHLKPSCMRPKTDNAEDGGFY